MNSLKSLAHAVHQAVQPVTPCKRSHVYELIAARFGFKTYAALAASHLLYAADGALSPGRKVVAAVQQRCRDLGYPETVLTAMGAAVVDALVAQQIDAVSLPDLLAALESGDDDLSSEDDTDEWADEEAFLSAPELLLGQLEERAAAGQPDAHYGLSRLCRSLAAREGGIENWWRQGQNGAVLSPVEQEWAEAHARAQVYLVRAETHLQTAARLGSGPARLALARQSGDVSILTDENGLTNVSPARVAHLASKLGREAEAVRWQIRGAAAGDVALMRTLLENETGSLAERWVWVYLAEHLGEEVLAGDLHAIHEDGSAYDDDVGGPMEVVGDVEIVLERLSPDEDRVARAEAARLYALLPDEAAGDDDDDDDDEGYDGYEVDEDD